MSEETVPQTGSVAEHLEALSLVAAGIDAVFDRLVAAETKLSKIAAKIDAFAQRVKGRTFLTMTTEQLATEGLAAMVVVNEIGEIVAEMGNEGTVKP